MIIMFVLIMITKLLIFISVLYQFFSFAQPWLAKHEPYHKLIIHTLTPLTILEIVSFL